MTKNQEIAVDFAKSKGFTHWATLNGIKLQFMDVRGINLFIDPEEKTFRFEYLVPKSIFRFICPECSPFDNEKHFDNIYRKFKREVVDCWSIIDD